MPSDTETTPGEDSTDNAGTDDAGTDDAGTEEPLSMEVQVAQTLATFPDGNPGAGTTRAQEVERLREKQEAGAGFAITQLFYEPESYTGFVADARAAGVSIPILAGLIPATEPARLRRIHELTGVVPPPGLLTRLEALTDPAEQHAYGIARSVELARAVIDAGAPGLHVYTFNRWRPALDLLRGVGLLPQSDDDPGPAITLAR